MRALEQALNDHELIVLRVIGEWWEMDLTGLDKVARATALPRLPAAPVTMTDLSFSSRSMVFLCR